MRLALGHLPTQIKFGHYRYRGSIASVLKDCNSTTVVFGENGPGHKSAACYKIRCLC